MLAFAAALASEDLPAAGSIMAASHASNRDDFEASTPVVDALVDRLTATPGVFGARLVGGGFGGCVASAHRTGRSGRRMEGDGRPAGASSVAA